MPVPITTGPVHIPLSDEERISGILTPLHLYDAVDALRSDGVVILDNAVAVEVCDKLNERMTSDAKLMLTRNKDLKWGQGKGHGNLLVPPPLSQEFLFPDIYGNKAATSVISHVIGPNPEVRFLLSNTSFPKEGVRQPVHKDGRHLHPTHPYCIAMNVNLIDVSPESGSTELWLGTNNDSPPTDWIEPGVSHINPALLEPRRAIRPPLQPTVKKGGVVLRDLRLWHAGVPNPSDDIRVMIVLLHFAQLDENRWFGNGEYIQMPRSLQPAIEATSARAGNKFICQWVEDKNWNYLDSRFAQDFSSKVHPEFWEPYREASEAKLAKMNM